MITESTISSKDQAREQYIARFEKDSNLLTEAQRLGVVKSFISRFAGVTDQEFDLLANQQYVPSASDPDNALVYANAEKKLGNFFGSSFARKGTEKYKRLMGQRRQFQDDLKQVLVDKYKPKEINEIFALMNPNAVGMDETYLVWTLVGNHPIKRRIRNAYLPEITTVLEVETKGRKITDVRDKTASVFDDKEEPVDSIDKLLGKNKL